MSPLVIPQDAQQVVADFIHDLLGTGALGAGWSVGTRIPAGVTPRRFIRVRMVDNAVEHVVLDRPVLQIQVWGDGQAGSEPSTQGAVRTLVAHLKGGLRAKIVAGPVPLPDPVDDSTTLVQVSAQLALRGLQA